MSYTTKPRTTTSNLSTISTNYELLKEKNTNNLIIRIELKYPEYMTSYLDIIENYVKLFGKKFRIIEFNIVYDWSSCDMWFFKTDVPFELIIE